MPTNRSRAGGRLAVVVVLTAIAGALLLAPQAGAYYTVVGDLPNVTGQAPRGVATDSSGNVYVTASFTVGVHKYAPGGTTQLTFWGGPGTADGKFGDPLGIAASTACACIYVVDGTSGGGTDRIQKFNPSGGFLGKWGSFGTADDQFNLPGGVATDAAGNVYVTDFVSNAEGSRIKKYDGDGNFITKWGTKGVGQSEFSGLADIAVSGSTLYALDSSNKYVSKWSLTGGFSMAWGNGQGPGSSLDGQFSSPEGIATDAAGNVWVADTQNHRVQEFDSTGTFLGKVGVSGSGLGQFSNPRDVAVGPDGYLYVVDGGNSRVEALAPATPGTTIDGIPIGTSDPTPTVTFHAETPNAAPGQKAPGFQCSLVPTGFVPSFQNCAGPAGTHTPGSDLNDGTYDFAVRATDSVGPDPTPATATLSVDAMPPTLSITGGPNGLTNNRRPTFSFNAEGGTMVDCSIDTGTESYSGCVGAAGTHTPAAALPDGAYTFRVRAVDFAGRETIRTRDFAVDATPPAVSITGGPTGPTTNNRPAFAFNADGGATVSCSITSGAASFGPCSGASSHSAASALSDGTYSFAVRAADAAGNLSTATRAFSVDTTAPAAPTLTATAPASPADNNSPAVIGDAEAGSTVRAYASADCSGEPVAEGSAAELQSPGLVASVADNTTTEFRATATDALGNRSACSAPIGYTEDSTPGRDLTPPQVTITSGPKGLVQGSKATFTFTATELVSFICKLDEQPYKVCTSPKTFRHLKAGKHKLLVSALDIGFNFDLTPASRSWKVAPR